MVTTLEYPSLLEVDIPTWQQAIGIKSTIHVHGPYALDGFRCSNKTMLKKDLLLHKKAKADDGPDKHSTERVDFSTQLLFCLPLFTPAIV